MSEQPLSQEEKRRLLRERRQAKMAKGKASDRLNNILSQGSSVKDTSKAVSVLDAKDDSTAAPGREAISSAISDPVINEHDDPDIMDIDNVTPDTKVDEADIDKMLSNIFGGNVGGSGAGGNQEDFLANMMNMMKQGDGPEGSPNMTDSQEELAYQTQLNAYNTYQKKMWKFRFLIIRYSAVLVNFFYHYVSIEDYSFSSSAHFYIRGLAPQAITKSFFTWFMTCEIAILASFFFVISSKNLNANSQDGNLLLKILSMGTMVLPQLRTYQPLVARLASYWELFGMLLADVFLVVVLFGFISIYK